MNIKESILNTKGKWLLIMNDKSKFVIDTEQKTFDNLKWYKEMGTLESDLPTNLDDLLKNVMSVKKIK